MAVNLYRENPQGFLVFLSCLYGSEPFYEQKTVHDQFLSCLYGSEPLIRYLEAEPVFLSCLYGSELNIGRGLYL